MAVKFKDTININGQYTLPLTDGTDGQVLVTDGSGNLTFSSESIAGSADSAESTHLNVKNTSGASIAKGTPVYVTGSVGNTDKLEIAPANASNASHMPAIGLLESTLADNGEGFVVQGGLLKGLVTDTIDGSASTANDTVYVKAGGGLTLTKPTGSTNFIQNIAKVARVHNGNGSLIVSSILRTNDVPNLSTGKIWVGDNNTIESTVVHIDETNGRLGIGTDSPTEKLHVLSGGNISRFESTTATSNVVIKNSTTTTKIGSVSNNFVVDLDPTNAVASSNIILKSDGTERMRITSAGNVGIGMTPSKLLDLQATDNLALRYYNNTTFKAGIEVATTAGDMISTSVADDFAIRSNSNILFASGGNIERMRIDSSGDSTFYGNTLIDNGINSTLFIGKGSEGVDGVTKIKSYQSGADTDQLGLQFYVHPSATGSASTELAMTIDHNKNVGIGTTSPDYKLQTYNSSNGTTAAFGGTVYGLRIDNGGTHSSTGTTIFGVDDTFYGSYQPLALAGSQLSFNTGNNAPRMTIDSSGNVGIGVTNVKGKLHTSQGDSGQTFVNPNANALVVEDNASNGISILTPSSQIGSIFFGDQNDNFVGGFRYDHSDNSLSTSVNNAVAMVIDSSRRVGIGTTSPNTILDVRGADALMRVAATNATGEATLELRGLGSNGTSNAISRIKSIPEGGGYAASLAFTTRNSSGTNIERLRINSSGNVGIGTDSPTTSYNRALHINDPANSSAELHITAGSGTTASDGLSIIQSGVTSFVYNREAGDMIFGTSNAERMRIDSSGVTTLTAEGYQLAIKDESSGNISEILTSNTAMGFFADRANAIAGTSMIFSVDNDTKMTISSSGNVGIGTTNPLDLLHIKSTTTDARLLLDGSVDSELKFAQSGTVKYSIGHDAGTGNFVIGTTNVDTGQRLVIDSSGRVGIGTTAPNAPLEILFNETNPNNDFSFAQKIDANFSGADNTTSDREQGGLWLDIDSSADGDLSDEHRLYGIYNDVRFTGFTDMVQGARIYVESNNSSETVTTVYGVNGVAVTDSNANGGIGTMIGSRGEASIQDAGSVTTAMGVEGRINIASTRTTDIGTTSAVRGEIQIDSPNAITYGDAIVFDAIFDNNEGSTNTNTNSYLFKGDYQGTKNATNAWGIYVEGNKHYLQGNLGIGTTAPLSKLHIENTSGNDGIRIINSTTGEGYIIFGDTADNNTGSIAYNHASDAMTFDVNNSERMRITSGGNVGIGISSGLTYPLTIQGETGVNNSYVHFVNATTGTAFSDGTQIGVPDGQSYFLINQRESSDIRINVGGSEKMRIDSYGVLQLTETSASSFLNGNGTSFELDVNRHPENGSFGDTNKSHARINLTGADGGSYIAFNTASANNTTATERMRIEADGDVGIGTSSPSARLQVRGSSEILRIEDSSSTGNPYMSFYQNGTRRSFIQHQDSGNMLGLASEYGGIRFMTATNGSEVERMRIDSSGRVGIGMTPSNYSGYMLQVNGGTQSFMSFGNSTTGTGALNGLVIGNDSTGADIYQREEQPLRFHTNNTERMRIDSSGNVGIGNTNPLNNLSIVDSGNATLEINGQGRVNSLTLGVTASESKLFENSNNALAFGTNATERMRIDSSGIVTGTITDDSFSDVDQLILKRIWSTGSSGDRSHGIALKDANSTMARIYADRVNSGANYKSDLVFITNTGATGTDTSEKMRITSEGNVTASVDMRAPVFYDTDNTGFFVNPASTSEFNQVDARYYDVEANPAYSLRFWGGSHSYSIRMSPSSNSIYGGRVTGETTSDYNMYFTMAAGTNRGFVFRSANSSSSAVAGIDASGNGRFIGDVVAYSSSDERLKDNKKNIDNALEKVESLNGVEFDWNDKQDVYEGHDIGVIAQEVEKIAPELVSTRDNGYKAVKYEKLVPLLIEAVKELSEKVKILENK